MSSDAPPAEPIPVTAVARDGGSTCRGRRASRCRPTCRSTSAICDEEDRLPAERARRLHFVDEKSCGAFIGSTTS